MAKHRDGLSLSYAEGERRLTFLPGLFWAGVGSFLLCFLQLPWTLFASWFSWAYLWRDTGVPARWYFLVTIAPSEAAIVLGLAALWGLPKAQWTFALLGIVGGIVWTVVLAGQVFR